MVRKSGLASDSFGDQIDEAKLTLRAFLSAMNEWEQHFAKCSDELRKRERTQNNSGATRQELWDERQQVCRAVFDQYCTPKKRATGKPSIMSFGVPSEFDPRGKIRAAEVLSTNRVAITIDSPMGDFRYHLVRKKGVWLVDHREYWFQGKWKQGPL